MSKKGTNIDTKLPTGWEWKTLGEVCKKASSNVSQNQLENEKGIYNIYGASGFIKKVSFYHQEKPYVGIVKDGAGVGRVTLLEGKSSVIGTLQYLIPNDEINIKYFYYRLLGVDFKKHINGSTIPHIYFKDYKNEAFLVVPLVEQTKIVSVVESTFSKIDKSIALVQENIEKIKQLNASVLDEVFEKLGSTNLKKLMEIADVKRGKSKHRPRNDKSLYGGKYPLVQTGDIRNCEKYLTKFSQTYNEKGLAQSKLWKKGTICLTIAANIGDVAILDFDACFPDSVLGIYSTTQNNNYLYYFLTSIKKKLDEKSSAAAQKNLSVEKLTDLYIPIPTLKTQEKIVAYLDNVYSNNAQLLEYYQTKRLSLQRLKNSVLESAFKGGLRKNVKEKKTAKVVVMPLVKKASDKFRKIEMLYVSICANKKDNIKQGEMAIAKDMYLIDRIGGVQTGFQFAQHNWGAFDPEVKQLIHTTKYFEKVNFPNSPAIYYDVKDNEALLEKIPVEIKQPIFDVVSELNQKLFAKYSSKYRPHKKELLATVLKCVEDTQSIDFDTIRTEMTNWKTPKQEWKNKAEKFTPQETKDVLGYIVSQGWEKKVINN